MKNYKIKKCTYTNRPNYYEVIVPGEAGTGKFGSTPYNFLSRSRAECQKWIDHQRKKETNKETSS